MSVFDRLQALRDRALKNELPARRKDNQLYEILAECLSVCEEVIRDNLIAELREVTRVSVNERQARGTVSRAESNNGKGRRYVNATSDAFTVVTRFVMWESETSANLSRYSSCIREAHKRGISPRMLPSWLRQNGGFVALYRDRQDRAVIRSTRTLYLDAPVDFQIGVPLTITVVPQGGGKFSLSNGAYAEAAE